jgi:hypothetical protein
VITQSPARRHAPSRSPWCHRPGPPPGAGSSAGADQQIGVWADADDGEDEVDVPADWLLVGAEAVDAEPAAVAARAGDSGDRRSGVHLHAVALEFGVHKRAELRVDRRENLGEHLDLRDGDAAGGEGFGHLQAYVAGADNQTRLGFDSVEAGGQGEGISHGMKQMHAIRGSEVVEAVDRWADRDRAGAHDQFVIPEPGRPAMRVTESNALAGGVDVGSDRVKK